MKSVKNFFERMNSTEQQEGGGITTTAAAASSSGGATSFLIKRLSQKKHKNGIAAATTDAAKNSAPSSASSSSCTAAIIDAAAVGDDVGDCAAFEAAMPPLAEPEAMSINTVITNKTPSTSSAQICPPDVVSYTADISSAPTPTTASGNNDKKSPFDFSSAAVASSASTATHSSSSSGAATAPVAVVHAKPQKNRRKISLPWFRQSSTVSHAGLSRQHTIDSPGSFRFFRQPSSFLKVGTQEATWVVSDYIGTPGSNELSVSKGQQVEIVEPPSVGEPDFCLVRLNPQSDDAAVQEGLVPVSILKPPPSMQKTSSSSSTAAARKDNNESIQETANNRGKPDPLTSSTKRRGFSGRKWLPQPLRKLSQSKVEKPADKALLKKSSEKNMKLPHKHAEQDEEQSSSANNVTSHTQHHHNHYGSSAASSAATAHQHQHGSATAQQPDYEAEDEVGLELPPPMDPIQDPTLVAANGAPTFAKDMKENAIAMANAGKLDGNTAIDLSEIEQIVKEKTEQHEEKSKFLKPNFDMNNSGCVGSSTATTTTTATDGASQNGRSVADGGSAELDLSYANNDHNVNNEENSESSISKSTQSGLTYVLNELVSTEITYIHELDSMVNGYLAEMRNPNSEIPIPEDLSGGKDRLIFGNIEQIYEWHRDFFLKTLQTYVNAPAELGAQIKRIERKLLMYVVYCQNEAVAEHLVSKHYVYFDQVREKLGLKMHLQNLLINPVQRLPRYKMLLDSMIKQARRAGLREEVTSLEDARQIIAVLCKTVNDMMDLRRLQNFEGKINAQGKLLMHGYLSCIDDTRSSDRSTAMVQKQHILKVFLFEQSIIFSDVLGKNAKFTTPSYIYHSHIQVNKMHLEELSNGFLLKSTDPNKPELSMICSAVSSDCLNIGDNKEPSIREWLETIRNILQSQHDFLKAITSPIQYQKELTKES